MEPLDCCLEQLLSVTGVVAQIGDDRSFPVWIHGLQNKTFPLLDLKQFAA